ncbi:hypothetical protein MAR_017595 [Mya arenaria]|uniref:Uncharacterized protein n=1 Tax=Mya arenaria TaxID=6604 RepID=A0ABY7EFE6_MYAAR|nr:hypothetical protein MAR_017595 [Mya arenaria]
MKQELDAYHQEMLESGKYSSLSAEHLWDNFHSTLTSLTKKFIPSQLSSSRNNLPWVNQTLKRFARKSDRAYRKQRKSGKAEDRKRFLDLKHILRKSIKVSYQSYLKDILDIASNDETCKPNTKNLFTLLKHSKQDSASVAPLTHQDDTAKATILNEQFQSKSPNSLRSLCNMKLQDISNTGKPQNTMPDIKATAEGIEKLLSNLNLHKASGPDQIKPVILKKPFDLIVTNSETSLPKVS